MKKSITLGDTPKQLEVAMSVDGVVYTGNDVKAMVNELAELRALQRRTTSLLDTDYPREFFRRLISMHSPYAFYIFQWVPYQSTEDANRWRLKIRHDVKTFDGRIQYGVWPNGNHCGAFKDDEVEFIRISRKQFTIEWEDPRGDL